MTLGLGEHGDVFYATENGRTVAMVYYRDYSGLRRRLRANGRSKAEARRRVNDALSRALAVGADGDFTARSTLADGANGWLAMYEGLVQRGNRSAKTLDLYRDAVQRHIVPGLGALRLGEITTSRLDRFLQALLVDRRVRDREAEPHGALWHLWVAGAAGRIAASTRCAT